MNQELVQLRDILANFDASVSHAASGHDRPKAGEIYAPEHHAGALDPHVSLVLGARGSGKSFWAGVLGHDDTREMATEAYPNLGLDKIVVKFGFIGQEGSGSVSRETIDSLVPEGNEQQAAPLLWRAVVLRAIKSALALPEAPPIRIKNLIQDYKDSEDWEQACTESDATLVLKGKTVLVLFDALDVLAFEHGRLRKLLDALLQVTWSMRSYRAIRLKLFLRDDQVHQLGLRFIELPKLLAGATRLYWIGTDLYGMLFSRLADQQGEMRPFDNLLHHAGLPCIPSIPSLRKTWVLSHDKKAQAQLFTLFAGQFMGRSHKKGRTYDWPLRHLSDGHNEVTPRSFMALMINAAKHLPKPEETIITAEGIRHGLREASKIRVDQLAREFPWITRVLVPLARLQVPCSTSQIMHRWQETGTYQAVRKLHEKQQFALPFTSNDEKEVAEELLLTLKIIGVLMERGDGRYDMPDLFRVAARLLKKGGVSPT